jgi:glycosyltransferase involved in cell wall biosynthesis
MHRVRAPRSLVKVGLGGVQGAIGNLARRVIVHEGAFRSVVPGAVVVPHGVEGVEPRADVNGDGPGRDGDRDGSDEGDERLTVLCFGFVAPYKGLELALEAASLAPDTVRLLIVGGEHPRLIDSGEHYADSLRERWPGVGEFAGYVLDAELPDWFARSDLALFLYPRPFATSGAMALAAAHGLPTLLSPGLAGLVGAPEELVAPTEAPVLAARLGELAGARDDLSRLREHSAAITRERSWETVAGAHQEIYAEVSNA